MREKGRQKALGNPLLRFDSVKSTNDIAKILADRGFDEGTCVSADFQSTGRGRLGRKWISPDGENIYISVILRPRKISKNILTVSLMAAYAVFKTITLHYKGEVFIKWPNDIFVNDKKISGILCEMKSRGDNIEYLVLGIGINGNSNLENLDRDVKKAAISLSILNGYNINKNNVINDLLENLDEAYVMFKNTNLKAIIDGINNNLYLKNSRCRFSTGTKIIDGTIECVNSDGSLRILNGDSAESFHAGEILI